MKKIMIIFGTRPEAVKMCPLVLELKRRDCFETVVCVARQHRETLEQVLQCFRVQADYDLDIMKPRQTLFEITATICTKLDVVLKHEKPDLLLVHGDTLTSFIAALSGFYERIPVGHVEAGLRTYDLETPFPEEFNRQATGLMARYHFAPTQWAADNLLREGKKPQSIFVTGNTVIDATRHTVREEYQHPNLSWADGFRLILMTAHRRENLGAPMQKIFRAVRDIVQELPDVKLLFPMHHHPKMREAAQEIFRGITRIRLTDPMDTLDFHNFMSRCYLVLTDSGGLQEEAPAFHKPVLVLRNTTERPEAVESDVARLIGTQYHDVHEGLYALLTDRNLYRTMSEARNPFGDGHTSERIADILERELCV